MSLIESHPLWAKSTPYGMMIKKGKMYTFSTFLLRMMVHGNGSFTTPIKYLPQKLINGNVSWEIAHFLAFLLLPNKLQVIIEKTLPSQKMFSQYSVSLWDTF